MEGVRAVPELRGIIPNSFAHIFGHIAKAEGDTRSDSNRLSSCPQIIHFMFSFYNFMISSVSSALKGKKLYIFCISTLVWLWNHLTVQVSGTCFILGDLQWGGAGLVGQGPVAEARGKRIKVQWLVTQMSWMIYHKFYCSRFFDK